MLLSIARMFYLSFAAAILTAYKEVVVNFLVSRFSIRRHFCAFNFGIKLSAISGVYHLFRGAVFKEDKINFHLKRDKPGPLKKLPEKTLSRVPGEF